MAYEQRELSGSCFVNDRKQSDNHPDWSGSALIDGKHYWVSMWDKTTSNGRQMRSLSFKPKEPQGGKAQSTPPRESSAPAQRPPYQRREMPRGDDVGPQDSSEPPF